VLVLYAGSGALGIEALSRGADRCDFVEESADGSALIAENLRLTGLSERGHVHRFKAERAASRLSGPYSLLFADPPYDDVAVARQTLDSIASSALLTEDAVIVWEHRSRRHPPNRLGPLGLTWSRQYGDTQVSIYRREDEAGNKGGMA
jgi:16S rRNA (guanine(966)-N(2))-methyltransferase RsmD